MQEYWQHSLWRLCFDLPKVDDGVPPGLSRITPVTATGKTEMSVWVASTLSCEGVASAAAASGSCVTGWRGAGSSGVVLQSVVSLASDRALMADPGCLLTLVQPSRGCFTWTLVRLASFMRCCIAFRNLLALAPPMLWASLLRLATRSLLDVA